MNARNRPRGPGRLPLKPLQLPGSPGGPEHARREAAVWGYLKRVLVDHGTADCDPGTAAALAGMVLGQHVHTLCSVRGMTFEDGLAAGLQWVSDQAALTASMAASYETTEGSS